MDYQDIMVSCKNCETKVPISKTRPVKNTPLLICLNCYKEIYGLNDEKIIQTADPNRSNYNCAYCGYKFSRNKELSVELCPYCGKQALSNEAIPVARPSQNARKLTDY